MTDDQILISVVIPNYNQSHLLSRAIESVLANTVQPVDIVVVDDGSTDGGCEAVCARNSMVRCIRQSNQGLTAARNNGAPHATGNWLLFLDADDWLLPNAIEELGRAARQSSDLGFVIGRSERRSAVPSEEPRQSPPINVTGNVYHDILVPGAYWHPAQLLLNAQIFQECGGFKLRHGSEDTELLLRLAIRHPFQSVPAVVAIYWQHSMSISKNSWKQYRATVTCFETHMSDPEFDARNRKVVLFARACRLDFYARGILLSGLADIRMGNGAGQLIRALGFVSVRRPAVLLWFMRLLIVRLFRGASQPAPNV